MKPFKSTGIFALLVAGLAIYAYLFEYVEKEKEEKEKKAAQKVLRAEKSKVTKIVIKNLQKKSELVLERKNKDWRIVSPMKDLADSSAVDSIVSIFSQEHGEMVVETDADSEEFGFSKPKGFFEIHAGDEKATGKIGSVKSFDGSHYLQREGESSAELVSANFATLWDKKVDEVRDKRVFRREFGKIKNIRFFIDGKEQFQLDRKDTNNSWTLKGIETPLDQGEVTRWVNSIQKLKATDFVSETSELETLKKFELVRPAKRISIVNDSESFDLRISSEKESKVWLRSSRRPTIFASFKTRVETLFKTVSDFKDKTHAFAFEKSKVAKVRVETEKLNLDLVKDGEAWKLGQPMEGKKLVANKVGNLLDRLSNLRADEFVGEQGKFEKNKSVITLMDEKGESILHLVWGETFKPKEGASEHHYLRTNLGKENLGVLVSRLNSLQLDQLLEENKKDSDKKEQKEKPEK